MTRSLIRQDNGRHLWRCAGPLGTHLTNHCMIGLSVSERYTNGQTDVRKAWRWRLDKQARDLLFSEENNCWWSYCDWIITHRLLLQLCGVSESLIFAWFQTTLLKLTRHKQLHIRFTFLMTLLIFQYFAYSSQVWHVSARRDFNTVAHGLCDSSFKNAKTAAWRLLLASPCRLNVGGNMHECRKVFCVGVCWSGVRERLWLTINLHWTPATTQSENEGPAVHHSWLLNHAVINSSFQCGLVPLQLEGSESLFQVLWVYCQRWVKWTKLILWSIIRYLTEALKGKVKKIETNVLSWHRCVGFFYEWIFQDYIISHMGACCHLETSVHQAKIL